MVFGQGVDSLYHLVWPLALPYTMNPHSQNGLVPLLLSREGGASELFCSAIDWLIRHPAAFSKEERQDTLEILRRTRPAMAVFAVLANRIEEALRETAINLTEDVLRQLKRELEQAGGRMARNFVHLLRTRAPVKMVTLSLSSSVLRALEVARELVEELYVLESWPGGEGRETASRASSFLPSVHLLPDEDLPKAVRRSDLGVLGADAVLPGGAVVSKVLSARLAELLWQEQKPLCALATSWKFSRSGTHYVLKDADRQLFEVVPADKITYIVSES